MKSQSSDHAITEYHWIVYGRTLLTGIFFGIIGMFFYVYSYDFGARPLFVLLLLLVYFVTITHLFITHLIDLQFLRTAMLFGAICGLFNVILKIISGTLPTPWHALDALVIPFITFGTFLAVFLLCIRRSNKLIDVLSELSDDQSLPPSDISTASDRLMDHDRGEAKKARRRARRKRSPDDQVSDIT